MAEQLPPGRELDALVAEKVMGWKWYSYLRTSVLFPPWRRVECWWEPGLKFTTQREHIDGCWFFNSSQAFQGGKTMDEFPAYSTDWRAAGEVVEKMRERGYLVGVVCGQHDNHVAVTFFRDPVAAPFAVKEATYRLDYFRESETGETLAFEAQAPTFPQATCLAALAACNDNAES